MTSSHVRLVARVVNIVLLAGIQSPEPVRGLRFQCVLVHSTAMSRSVANTSLPSQRRSSIMGTNKLVFLGNSSRCGVVCES
ncbi:hypothetical protein M758_2G035300 [Ceratodon purpureus]|uniref:Secreted protein n=1 Tax=Ceratodon purpureus TaxID=3225 RepID=A0A8T0IRH8_CERPU|nr:hypothetical protein KC19_2G036600 [Ceratodon purpureus]KAG0625196.1 hypothetical protein M758_2G035300 [Ceratodon purpureus]